MTSHRHFLGPVRAFSSARGSADEFDLVNFRLEKLETAKVRLRVVHALSRSRDAGALKNLGYGRPAISRMLNSSGDRAPLAERSARILSTNRQIIALRRLARELGGDATDECVLVERHHVDAAAGRIVYRFAGKPDKSVRALLRRAGFVHSGTRNTYARPLDAEGRTAAAWLDGQLDKLQR